MSQAISPSLDMMSVLQPRANASFDVTAANITPDPETGIGKWSAGAR
jgi:hypothetical protein